MQIRLISFFALFFKVDLVILTENKIADANNIYAAINNFKVPKIIFSKRLKFQLHFSLKTLISL